MDVKKKYCVRVLVYISFGLLFLTSGFYSGYRFASRKAGSDGLTSSEILRGREESERRVRESCDRVRDNVERCADRLRECTRILESSRESISIRDRYIDNFIREYDNLRKERDSILEDILNSVLLGVNSCNTDIDIIIKELDDRTSSLNKD